MKKFDTKVQHLKYKVLREVIKKADRDDLQNVYRDVPKRVVPGPKASMRCCIYKERAIVQERIKMALGGDEKNPNVVEVIDEMTNETIKIPYDTKYDLYYNCLYKYRELD